MSWRGIEGAKSASPAATVRIAAVSSMTKDRATRRARPSSRSGSAAKRRPGPPRASSYAPQPPRVRGDLRAGVRCVEQVHVVVPKQVVLRVDQAGVDGEQQDPGGHDERARACALLLLGAAGVLVVLDDIVVDVSRRAAAELDAVLRDKRRRTLPPDHVAQHLDVGAGAVREHAALLVV